MLFRSNQKNFAKQNRQPRQDESNGDIAKPSRIRFQFQIPSRFDSEPAQQRPEQHNRSQQKRAVKERFEIELRQRGKNTVGSERLGRPKKNWRCQGAEKNRSDEIGEQSGCVFQAANVRFGPDAQSTHMDGER